ncbi:MAG: hypothetical protein IPP33_13485 [Flavobacteriales bacterium]|nr:hypothetical protein [Flavobacteriales bacterium]
MKYFANNSPLAVRKGAWLLVSCLVLVQVQGTAQKPTPAPPQSKSILLKGGTLHVGNGTSIDDAAVGFRNGLIDYVGHSYGITATYDTVINTIDQHIYPGLILPDNSIGLHEVDLVRATEDADETGRLEPEVRAMSAFNTDSRIIPTLRSNGVLIAQSTPRGEVIAGTSSVVQLDAWDNSTAAIKVDDGVHMTWPKAYDREGWWAEPGDVNKGKGDERTKSWMSWTNFSIRPKRMRNCPNTRQQTCGWKRCAGSSMGRKHFS